MTLCMRDDDILRWGHNLDRNRARKDSPYRFFANLKRSFVMATHDGIKQRVTVKFSYTRQHTKEKIKSNTESAVAYAFKLDDSAGFGSKPGNITEQQAQEMMQGKKVFKVIISPEDPALANEEYVRKVIEGLEKMLGRKLVWVAVQHDDTDHPHVHVIISREDGQGLDAEHPLRIDPGIIKRGLREMASDIATRIRGYVNRNDIYRRQYFETDKAGYTSLDTKIGKLISDNGFLSLKSLSQVNASQRRLLEKRLEVLEQLGIGVTRTGRGYIFDKDWKVKLHQIGKLRTVMPDASSDGFEDVVIAKEQEPSERKTITGRIIATKVVDEINDRVGVVIEGDDGKRYYHEQQMDWKKYRAFEVGKRVKLSWKGIRSKKVDKRYEILDMEMEL